MNTSRKKAVVVLCCFVTVCAVGIVSAAGAMGGMNFMSGTSQSTKGTGGQSGTSQSAKGTGEESAALQTVISVEAEQAGNGTIELVTRYIGKIEPAQSLDVYSEISGKVIAAHAQVGDTVKKGDLLFEIDSSDIQSDIESAALSLESTKLSIEASGGSSYQSQLNNQTSSLKSAQFNYQNALNSVYNYRSDGKKDDLDDALESAQSAVSDTRSLYTAAQAAFDAIADEFATLGTSAEEYEFVKAQYDSLKEARTIALSAYTDAQNAYSQAKSSYEGYDDQLTALEKTLKQASLSLESAENSLGLTTGQALEESTASANVKLRQAELSYNNTLKKLDKTKVYAPMDGIVQVKNISEQQTASTQSAAYTLTTPNQMVAAFHVSGDAAGSVRLGDTVSIEHGSYTLSGTIVEMGNEIDASTGLLTLKAQLSENDLALISGMTVKVSATTSRAQDALVVPLDAINYEEGQGYLYKLEGTTARKTPVTTGLSTREEIEILSGISLGDSIITSWHPDLSDGCTVSIVEQESASSSAPQESAESSKSASSSSSSSSSRGARASSSGNSSTSTTAGEELARES